MIAFTVQKIKVSSGANAEKRTMKMEAKTGAERGRLVSHEKTFRDAGSGQLNIEPGTEMGDEKIQG